MVLSCRCRDASKVLRNCHCIPPAVQRKEVNEMNNLPKYVMSSYVTMMLLLATTAAAGHPMSSSKFDFGEDKLKVNDPVINGQSNTIMHLSVPNGRLSHMRNLMKLQGLDDDEEQVESIPTNLFRVVLRVNEYLLLLLWHLFIPFPTALMVYLSDLILPQGYTFLLCTVIRCFNVTIASQNTS